MKPTKNQEALAKHRCILCYDAAWPHRDKDHGVMIRLGPVRRKA